MNKRRNWLAAGAFALAGLALLVALGGFFRSSMMSRSMAYAAMPMAQVQAQAEPQRGWEREDQRGGPPAFVQERFESRQAGPPAMMGGQPGHSHGMMMSVHRPMNPLAMLFGLIDALTKIAALGLLGWLLLTIYKQRQQGTNPPPAPMTPAGHDPRVE